MIISTKIHHGLRNACTTGPAYVQQEEKAKDVLERDSPGSV